MYLCCKEYPVAARASDPTSVYLISALILLALPETPIV